MQLSKVAKKESMFFAKKGELVGVRIRDLSCGCSHLEKIEKIHKDVNHILINEKIIRVLLRREALDEDILKAYVHIYLVNKSNEVDINQKVISSLEILNQEFPNIMKLLQFNNWDTSNFQLLPSKSWRVDFNIEDKKDI